MSIDQPRRVDRIRGALAARRITQTDVAEALGITQPGVSRRLTGETEWRLTELRMLARAFDIPLVELIGEDTESSGIPA